MIATLIMAGSGKGAAAASVILHRMDGPSTGLAGLAMFLLCMAIVVFAWTRLRGNRSGT